MRTIILLSIIMLLFAGYGAAEVVVFENYETNSYLLPDGKLRIERVLQLKNIGSNPIIPGELHFKLHEIKKKQRLAPKVSDFTAENAYGTELKTRKVEGQEEVDLVVSVWEPVLPRFTYQIFLSYDLRFKPKGLLFYELTVPIEETTIPIRNNEYTMYLPASDHITYAPDAEVKLVEKDSKKYRSVNWVNRRDMVVEFSKLPLPKLGIRGVNIFWIVVIISLLLLTFLIQYRSRR